MMGTSSVGPPTVASLKAGCVTRHSEHEAKARSENLEAKKASLSQPPQSQIIMQIKT